MTETKTTTKKNFTTGKIKLLRKAGNLYTLGPVKKKISRSSGVSLMRSPKKPSKER